MVIIDDDRSSLDLLSAYLTGTGCEWFALVTGTRAFPRSIAYVRPPCP